MTYLILMWSSLAGEGALHPPLSSKEEVLSKLCELLKEDYNDGPYLAHRYIDPEDVEEEAEVPLSPEQIETGIYLLDGVDIEAMEVPGAEVTSLVELHLKDGWFIQTDFFVVRYGTK